MLDRTERSKITEGDRMVPRYAREHNLHPGVCAFYVLFPLLECPPLNP